MNDFRDFCKLLGRMLVAPLVGAAVLMLLMAGAYLSRVRW